MIPVRKAAGQAAGSPTTVTLDSFAREPSMTKEPSMTRRIARVLAGALLLMIATGQAALAHEEVAPQAVETGKPAFLTVSAANEKEAPVTRVAVTLPEGAEAGETTRSPAGWKAAIDDNTITWTGGSLAPGAFEQFGFEIEEAAQPGTLTLTVALTAGGDTEQSQVPLTVVARGAGTAQAPAPGASTVVSASTPVGSAAADRSKSRANLALGVGAAGLLLGLAAMGAAVTRRRTGTTAAAQKPVPQDF
jgi:hypothetical protein